MEISLPFYISKLLFQSGYFGFKIDYELPLVLQGLRIWLIKLPLSILESALNFFILALNKLNFPSVFVQLLICILQFSEQLIPIFQQILDVFILP